MIHKYHWTMTVLFGSGKNSHYGPGKISQM